MCSNSFALNCDETFFKRVETVANADTLAVAGVGTGVAAGGGNSSTMGGGAVAVQYGCNADNIDLNDPDVLAARMNPASNASSALPFFIDCMFENNQASGNGGALSSAEDTRAFFVTNCVFKGNKASGCNTRGGAVALGYGSRVVGRSFSNNSAVYGGAVYAAEDCVTVRDAVFEGNTGSYGSGFCGVARSEDCVFTGGSGPAVFVFGRPMSASRLVITNNLGGGIEINGSMTGCVFDRCEVRNNGGKGLSQSNSASDLVLRNSLFAANGDYGLNVLASVSIENCTIADNANRNVTIANGTYEVALTNSVIANPRGGTSWTLYSAGPSVTAVNCCGAEATHVTSVNPVSGKCLFADPESGDYRLQRRSCLRDAALRLDWMTSDAKDLAGNPRVYGPAPDVGCFENQDRTRGMVICFR